MRPRLSHLVSRFARAAWPRNRQTFHQRCYNRWIELRPQHWAPLQWRSNHDSVPVNRNLVSKIRQTSLRIRRVQSRYGCITLNAFRRTLLDFLCGQTERLGRHLLHVLVRSNVWCFLGSSILRYWEETVEASTHLGQMGHPQRLQGIWSWHAQDWVHQDWRR